MAIWKSMLIVGLLASGNIYAAEIPNLCRQFLPLTDDHDRCITNHYAAKHAIDGGAVCVYDETGAVCYRRELRDDGNYVYKYYPVMGSFRTVINGDAIPVSAAEDWFYIRMQAVDSAHLFLPLALMDYPDYPYRRVIDSHSVAITLTH